MEYRDRIPDIDRLQAEIDVYRPLPEHAIGQLRQHYRIGLTWTSNALEGNSLTESETKVIIEDGLTIGGRSLREHQEVVGHSDAYDLLYRLAGSDRITEEDILSLHRLFYHRLDETNAGIYRQVAVIITGSDHFPPKPASIASLMKALVDSLPDLKRSSHPVEYAARLHAELVSIHPFIDGNGRTARLVMNLALVQAGYVITLIPPVLRPDYLDALRAYNHGQNRFFINFISTMVHESTKEYLRLLDALDPGRDSGD